MILTTLIMDLGDFMEFIFGIDIIERVAQEIKKANKYVRIAVFQVHNGLIYDALEHALNRDVIVEILKSLAPKSDCS